MEYKGKLNLDMQKANSYLSEQTISFGNKTVITSALIILISLNFITITGIEIEGIAISINTVILTIVLQVVNFYYYQQFILSYDADKHKDIMGYDYDEVQDVLLSSYSMAEHKLKELISEKENIQNEFTTVDTSLQRKKELLERLTNLDLEFKQFGDIIERSKEVVKKEDIKISNFISIVKRYRVLNFKIPQIIYFVGLSAVFLKFAIYIFVIFDTQNEPWEYLWQHEFEYYKLIFKSK